MFLRQGVDGDRRPPEEEDLQDEEPLWFWHEAVEGGDEEQDERGVIAEQVAAHDRHERGVEMGDEPEALVEDGEVKRRVAVAVVGLEAEKAEPEDIAQHEQRHRKVPRPPAGADSATSWCARSGPGTARFASNGGDLAAHGRSWRLAGLCPGLDVHLACFRPGGQDGRSQPTTRSSARHRPSTSRLGPTDASRGEDRDLRLSLGRRSLPPRRSISCLLDPRERRHAGVVGPLDPATRSSRIPAGPVLSWPRGQHGPRSHGPVGLS